MTFKRIIDAGQFAAEYPPVKRSSALYTIPLSLLLLVMQCKEKKDQTPAFDKPGTSAGIPATAPDTAGGKRWVWSSDGVILREEPKRSAKQLALIPRGEEIETFSAAAAPPVADTVSGDAGHWVKANVKGKVGWVFDVFLSSPVPVGALEFNTQYKMKAGEFSDEQYFTFAANGTAKYVTNHCEGFQTHSDKFTVQKGQVSFKEDASLKLEIHGRTNLLMTTGAEAFTCNNVTGALQFEIKGKS
jgi:Bacterial SH3 domain